MSGDHSDECTWCGSTSPCDCEDRMHCPMAGAIGHQQCGQRPCGCPVLWSADHVCPRKENPYIAETHDVDPGTGEETEES